MTATTWKARSREECSTTQALSAPLLRLINAGLQVSRSVAGRSSSKSSGAVCDVDAVSRNAGLRPMREGAGEEPYDGRGHTDYALLAHPYSYSAEDVHAASVDDLRRDTRTHSEGMGSVLHYQGDLEEVFLHFRHSGMWKGIICNLRY